MKPDALRAARHTLGLSAEGFARLVGVSGGRTVRKWESGETAIPGPVAILADLALQLPEVRRYLGIALEGATTAHRPVTTVPNPLL